MEAIRKLDKKLGIGARGVVYQGFDEHNGRFVAIKEIPLIERSFANGDTPLRPSHVPQSQHLYNTSGDDDVLSTENTATSQLHDAWPGTSTPRGHSPDRFGPRRSLSETDVNSSRADEEEEAAIILREIRVMERATHPNLVHYYGTRRSAVGVQIIMEFVGGGSLESLLRRCHTLRENVVRRYTRDILQGLVYLHESMHVCHRDIKPGNVLLTTEGVCKLTDFGVSKLLGGGTESSPPASRRGHARAGRGDHFMRTTVGTPWYMAPEVISGGVDDDDVPGLDHELRQLLSRGGGGGGAGADEGYSTAADIWSLGVTVFEMLSGERPFGAGLHNPSAVLFHIVNTAATDTPQLPDSCDKTSQAARDFLELCFVYDRTLRPSARELLSHAWFRLDEEEDVVSDTAQSRTGFQTLASRAAGGHKRGTPAPSAPTQVSAPLAASSRARPAQATADRVRAPKGKFVHALDTFDVSRAAGPASTRAGVSPMALVRSPPRHRVPSQSTSPQHPPSSARSPSASRSTTRSGWSNGSTTATPHDPAAARYALLRQHASQKAAALTPTSQLGAGHAPTSVGLWTRDGYYVDLMAADPLDDL